MRWSGLSPNRYVVGSRDRVLVPHLLVPILVQGTCIHAYSYLFMHTLRVTNLSPLSPETYPSRTLALVTLPTRTEY
jgi:hypothetical protein